MGKKKNLKQELLSRIEKTGNVIIEYDGYGYLLVFPDGRIISAKSHSEAERKVKAYFKKNLSEGKIGLGTIEWRRT